MDFAPLAHVFPDTTKITPQGHLEIGGCNVADLVAEYGTPLYVLCEDTLRAKCREFLEAFTSLHPETEVHYASKAYIGPALAKIMAEEGLGLDVVSGGELAVARIAGAPPEGIAFHGNNKSAQELSDALDYGIGHIMVDNLTELDLLNKLASERGMKQAILLRVTPGIDPHTHAKTTTGLVDSKFGLNISNGQAAEAVRRALNCESLELKGLHFHLGSPIFEFEPYIEAIEVVLDFAAQYREEGFELQEFSPGGGFAIAYLRDDRPPKPAEYAAAIVGALRQGCEQRNLPMPKMSVEPGRSVVGPAGVAFYTVGSIKYIPGVRTYAAVDGGMGDNIRPALYEAKYEAVVATRMNEEPSVTYTVAGKFCESGDILVEEALLPPLSVGDIIAMPAAGAYSPSMASNYNENPRPPIVLVKDGNSRVIRRRETAEDLMRADVW
jgi:diaminopimelate decarboxylase